MRFSGIILILVIATTALMAQTDEYTRKSITFLDAIILASPSARDMSVRQIDYTADVVKRQVQLERFDFNPIPASSGLMTDFITQVNNADELDMDAISDMLDRTFVAEIVKIIDENAEQRASELVDETARMSFVATKAKDLGITAENLEQVFNSGYIYLPFINGFSEELEAKEEDDVMKYHASTTISGGILWFKIDYRNGQTSVKPLLKEETRSSGVAAKKDAKESEWNSFKAAADNYARNLEVATKDIEDFKLKTQIMEVTGTNIGFNMGRKEGIHIDDRFIVGEMMMNADGELVFKKDGFARVKAVGNNIVNPGEFSYGYGVIVGDWAPGMSLVEYPTLGIDLYGMLGVLPLSTDESGFELSSAIAIGIDLAYNIGELVGTPHWYITAGAALGTAELDDGFDSYFGGSTFIDIGVMKR